MYGILFIYLDILYIFRYLIMKVLSCYIFKEIMNDQISALYLMFHTRGQASNE